MKDESKDTRIEKCAEQSEPAKPQSGRCAQRVHAFGDPSEESDCGFPKDDPVHRTTEWFADTSPYIHPYVEPAKDEERKRS